MLMTSLPVLQVGGSDISSPPGSGHGERARETSASSVGEDSAGQGTRPQTARPGT